jgi:hypothetical protein
MSLIIVIRYNGVAKSPSRISSSAWMRQNAPAMNAPDLTHLCDLKVDVAAPIEMDDALGAGGGSSRSRAAPSAASPSTGTFSISAPASRSCSRTPSPPLDTRYALRTHDGGQVVPQRSEDHGDTDSRCRAHALRASATRCRDCQPNNSSISDGDRDVIRWATGPKIL